MNIPSPASDPAPSVKPFRQVRASVTLGPRNVKAIRLAMLVNEEESFSRALDTIVTEAMAVGVPYFRGKGAAK
jgi:hypothetical protein